MNEELKSLLIAIVQSLEYIHSEMVLRNAYDVGIFSRVQYEEYLKNIISSFNEGNKEVQGDEGQV